MMKGRMLRPPSVKAPVREVVIEQEYVRPEPPKLAVATPLRAPSAELDGKKYFWSPSVHWENTGSEIRIEAYSYGDIALRIFPSIYFLTRNGKTVSELLAHFSDVDGDRLRKLLADFVKNRILVTGIQGPHEIFHPQTRLFQEQNPYTDEILFDPEKYERFKDDQLNRSFGGAKGPSLALPEQTYPNWIARRRSVRDFREGEPVPFPVFSQLLSLFKQNRGVDGKVRYHYASGGGLYPIDVFVHVKEQRVENVEAGIYHFNPQRNTLDRVGPGADFSQTHYAINRPVAKGSAFSLFFVFAPGANMPKYGGSGFFYACIEVGIMVATLTCLAQTLGIGVCSIGEMPFQKIEHHFNLDAGSVFLHVLEAGIR